MSESKEPGKSNTGAPTVPAGHPPAFISALSLQQRAEPEKPGLQKVYRLFNWTNNAVKQYGQDRLEIMLESYRIMGYLSAKSKEEILGIMQILPDDLGAAHTVTAGEYVSELYALRRILVPDDVSLDRDMIAVLMEQRRQAPGTASPQAGEKDLVDEMQVTGENPEIVLDKGIDLKWKNLHS